MTIATKTLRGWLTAAGVVLMSLLALPAVCRADGFIVVHDPPNPVPGHFSFAPLEVAYHRVDVSIDDRVATTSVDQEFLNPNNARMEGTYLFPLPDGATIDKFSMDIDGTEMQAEMLPSDRARSIYEDIVRRSRDPALMEYVGRGALRVRIFPIEPNSKKRIRLKYTQVLSSDSGLTEYVYPLNTEKFSARPLKDVSVRVKLACGQPLKSVYSPSHSVDVKRDGDRRATIGYEEKDARPDTDFKLIFSTDADPVGIDLLTFKDSSDDGYFMLLASPGMDVSPGQVQPRDVCFVLDTSGSMAGPKLEQAKKALRFCLANLNPGDRFELIRFSTEAEPLFDKLVPADEEHLAKAESFIRGLKPIGGTAISEALEKAMDHRPGRNHASPAHDLQESGESGGAHAQLVARPYVVIFLTDGQPTVGETKEDVIVELVKKRTGDAKVFAFGIGTDINTTLLDRVANETKAFSQYVLPEEDIELKVSSFYTKIKEPALAGVKLDFGGDGVRVSEVYPNAMPDLYKGQTLVAFGRYRGDGPGAVRIAGTLPGERREFADDVTFTANDTRHAFIPRLWATRRVGWLLDEIRLRGESKELKDEVVRLAREHGIVTPYTAYLILEDEARRNVPVASRTFQDLEADRLALGTVAGQYASARGAGGPSAGAGMGGYPGAPAEAAAAPEKAGQIGRAHV